MSSIFSLPPLLFVTFHELYGVSYTLLGTLVLVNFCTQLAVDLIFTVLSKRINVKAITRVMPLITSVGLMVYALSPWIFPGNVYVGLVIGTFIFSLSSGLSEVLLSPTIAAIPSDNPQRDMSMLHSLYAVGILTVILITTAFFHLFDRADWQYLTLFFAALPIIAFVLFAISPMPPLSSSQSHSVGKSGKRYFIVLAYCVGCIFFGSCAENVMTNWVSGFMENALQIDKALGDILGMAMFAVLLAVTRITYAKFGKKITRMLLIGMVGAMVCYVVAGLSLNPAVVLVVCALTGMFTAMLWPGALIMMEENIPGIGVAAYALMAAGGDLGASIAPQLMGIVVDEVSASGFALDLSVSLGLTVEQIGMRAGMLVTAIFPLIGTVLLIFAIRYFRKTKAEGSALLGENDQ